MGVDVSKDVSHGNFYHLSLTIEKIMFLCCTNIYSVANVELFEEHVRHMRCSKAAQAYGIPDYPSDIR